jgi:membrane-bound lytic murein transglycosylase MltF
MSKTRATGPATILFVLLVAAGTLPLGAAPAAAAWAPSPDSVRLADLGLGPEERAWLDSRLSTTGRLDAALVNSPDAYQVMPDGSIHGFDYLLVREFAGTLGLRLAAQPQDRIEPFFAKDGVMPKDLGAPGISYDYTPDLLKKVDLYASPFGISPWRQEMMVMVPLFPTRNQLAGRRGTEIRDLRELDGKRIAVIEDSYQQNILTNMANAQKIRLTFVFGKEEGDLFRLVSAGKADYLLDASVIFAKFSRQLGNLSISPYPEDIVMTGWGIKKSDTILASILAKFVVASQKRGIFGRLWGDSYGMDFPAYLGAVFSSPGTPGK